MDEMREIVTMPQANTAFLALAIATPLLAAVVFALLRARMPDKKVAGRVSSLIALAGPVNLAAWKVYNAITDRLGLDSVKNLLVNLALFVVIGIVAGLAFGKFWNRGPAAGTRTDTETGAAPSGEG